MMKIAERHESLYKQIPSFKCKEDCNDCCGINVQVLHGRLKLGWSVEKALTMQTKTRI